MTSVRHALAANLPFLVLAALASACSSSGGSTTDTGSVSLGAVTGVKRAATVLRFTASVKNTSAKGVKTVDSIEIDTGSGPKKAATLRTCGDGQTSPWLVKARGDASLEWTVRNNGPDRQAVEATCLDASGKATSSTALWEFQTFTTVDTNTGATLKIALNGTYDDGSIWTATASE